jgi:hypothetical protein
MPSLINGYSKRPSNHPMILTYWQFFRYSETLWSFKMLPTPCSVAFEFLLKESTWIEMNQLEI